MEFQQRWVQTNAHRETGDIPEYKVGDLVLYRAPEGRTHKIQPIWLGPVVIVGRYRENAYVVHNAATGMVRTLSVDRLKKFKSDPSIPDGEVALADDNIYIVEAVERHRLRSKGKKRQTKSNYEFLVKFEGFDVSEW